MRAGTWGVFNAVDALVARGVSSNLWIWVVFLSVHHVVLSKVGLGELTEQGPNVRRRLWIAASCVCMYVYMHIGIYLYNRRAPGTCCCFFFGGKNVKFGSK